MDQRQDEMDQQSLSAYRIAEIFRGLGIGDAGLTLRGGDAAHFMLTRMFIHSW